VVFEFYIYTHTFHTFSYIIIHTDAQVGLVSTNSLILITILTFTLTFLPTWGQTHSHSFYKSNVKYKNDTWYKNIPSHRYQ